MLSSQTTITVIRLRTTMAPAVPQRIARFCSCTGRLRAARAMTIALSPASTRSMTTIARSAERDCERSIGVERQGGNVVHEFSARPPVRCFAIRDPSRIAIDAAVHATGHFDACQNGRVYGDLRVAA